MLRRFMTNDSGATAIEYALIALFISLGLVAGATTIGTKLSSTFSWIAGKF